jgi:F-type H+-transporting ATPase subunit epsilon
VAKAVPFKLITPTSVVFEGDAELVIAVTTEGEEGILPSHAPFLAALRPGLLRANVVKDGAAQRLELASGEGFLQALPDGVTILVDAALGHDAVDVAQAQRDLAEATERQKSLAPYTADYEREQAIIDFANAKLRITGHH